MERATVVVESRKTALREAGDVILALAEGRLSASALVTMTDLLVSKAVLPADRPAVVKTSGMAWEDLVVAVAVYQRRGRATT
jgi:ornithine cyclodeaminase